MTNMNGSMPERTLTGNPFSLVRLKGLELSPKWELLDLHPNQDMTGGLEVSSASYES
ncbi:hypothetical protein [Streptomyces sp. NPDC093970]|uniref:hypothetical protein n=1 Tax=Streptomyces sp. NPDC093970 TaxID=3155076 RepID=UPI00341A1C1B